jgi:hypothetical protein
VFLATGVWHGAAWTFVLWGAYHGTFLLIERVSGLRYIDDAIWQWPRRFATFFIVMLGWVLFRSESLAQAGHFYSALFSFNGAFVSPELALELTGKNLAWVDLALFNHSYSPQVSVGQDDWLFLKRDVYARHADPVSPMADGIKRVGEALASHGIQFIFVIAPNKSAIYPEKLGTMLARATEASSKRRTEMQSLMAERAGTYFVDLWTNLLKAKSTTPRPLYLTLDTHWSPTGAAIASEAVVDRLHPGLWDDAALVISSPTPRLGDLSHMLGLDRTEPVRLVTTSRPGVVVTETQDLKDIFGKDTASFSAKSSERTVGGTGWFYDPDYQSKIEEAVQQSVALRR